MWNDLRFAFRVLMRSPGFTAVAVLSLALGIGANTAISSLIYQVAVRSLPVAEPERLVALESDEYSFGWARRDNSTSVFSKPMYEALRNRAQVFSGLIARAAFRATLAYRGPASNAQAEVVSGNFFEVLGVRPALGRLLTEGDDQRAREPVAVLSYAYWKDRLGGDSGVLNQRVLMNAHPVLVIGVAPAMFRGLVAGNSPDLFVPLSMIGLVTSAWERDSQVDAYWLNLFGRLNSGITARRADAELLPLFRSILEEELPKFKNLDPQARSRILGKTLRVSPAGQGLNELRRQWQTPLVVLMAMTGFMLLIACAKVANLLLAKAAARQIEIAVRLAVGATRLQLIRQLLVESVSLAMAGGLAGIAISPYATEGLLRLLPANSTGGWLSAHLDGQLLGYGVLLSLITGALFGFAPAWGAVRAEISAALKNQGSGLSASGSQSQLRRVLVSAQICLSLLLLIGAGMFTRTLYNLLNHKVGFEPERLITFSVDPSLNGYSRERGLAFFRELRQRLANFPGVNMAASAELVPFGGSNWGTGVKAPGTQHATDRFVDVQENSLSSEYFRTLGTPLLAGRDFTAADTERSPKVAILNQTLARFLFANENPIGRHLTVGGDQTDVEIVGVVADSKFGDIRESPERFLYVPYEQQDDDFTRRAAFFVRTRGRDSTVNGAIATTVKQMDANVPIERMETMSGLIQDSATTERLLAILVLAFGVVAASLAAVGLYGTISYAVTRRTREFGIRIALGAAETRILGLVLREVCWMLAAGIAVGLPASYALARLVESQLFGIRAHDPGVLIGATLLMTGVAIAAGLVPGARAMRVEPVRALRHE